MKVRRITPKAWEELQQPGRAKDKPLYVSDGGGLRVRIARHKIRNPDPDRGTGDVPEYIYEESRIWQFRYRKPDGSETVKSYGWVSIEQARGEWAADKALLDEGIDPLEVQKRTREDRKAKALEKRRQKEEAKQKTIIDTDSMWQLCDD